MTAPIVITSNLVVARPVPFEYLRPQQLLTLATHIMRDDLRESESGVVYSDASVASLYDLRDAGARVVIHTPGKPRDEEAEFFQDFIVNPCPWRDLVCTDAVFITGLAHFRRLPAHIRRDRAWSQQELELRPVECFKALDVVQQKGLTA